MWSLAAYQSIVSNVFLDVFDKLEKTNIPTRGATPFSPLCCGKASCSEFLCMFTNDIWYMSRVQRHSARMLDKSSCVDVRCMVPATLVGLG